MSDIIARSRDNFRFVTEDREDPKKKTLDVRKTQFVEIYHPFEADDAQVQSERCLECGNPYCEWKCPVHNYIPNWLKLAQEDNILEAAERNLRLALSNNPDHPIANNELGIVLRKTGRFAEARKHYQAALAVYPGYHYARRNLAVLCDLYLADLDCALQNYQAYMTTVPSDDEASMWIKDLQYRLNQREEQR